MSKASLDNELRNNILNTFIKFVDEVLNMDCKPVSASEVVIPVIDREGNEKYALVKVSIPRGTRNGDGTYTPYDGYGAAEEWEGVLADRADKAAARKEKADRAAKERERKRAAKRVIKKLNTEGFHAMVHDTEGE